MFLTPQSTIKTSPLVITAPGALCCTLNSSKNMANGRLAPTAL